MRAVDERADTMDAVGGASGDGIAGGGALVAGRYRIQQLLGSGGMGSVYRALDTQLEELVALKTLKRERLQSPGALERFRREVKLSRKVTHRGVARVFDLGEHEGEPFLTMELVDGTSLASALEGRALPIAEVVRIGESIAEALSVAHLAGVVHRDLKPDNVLLAKDGRVVLTDFGIARALDATDGGGATGAGAIVGTPAYMAPEQVEGTEVDARTDLYALGVVLFEMATGTLPFEGSSPLALAAARLVRPPADIASRAPHLPLPFLDLVRSLLARSPTARPPSADVVRAQLASFHAAAASTKASVAVVREARERRLAVMRLRGPGGDDAWVADGFSEDLVDALSTVRGLRVRGLRPPGDAPLEARIFGQREGVELVVEGSARRQGDQVRISLRLVSVDDGFQVWAQRFDSNVGGLLGVSDGAAHEIAKVLAGAEHDTGPVRNAASEVVELVLRARAESRAFGQSQALPLLEKALELAPDDPTVLSSFASICAAETFRPGVDPQLLERGRIAGERALELAPQMPEPYVARALIQVTRDDRAGAVRTLFAGRAHGPSFAEIDDSLGRILLEADRIEQARAHLERAVWIDPRLFFARVDLSRLEAMMGHRARAEGHLEALHAMGSPYYAVAAGRLASWWQAADLAEGVTPSVTMAGSAIHVMLKAARGGPLEQSIIDDVERAVAAAPPVSRARRLYLQCLAESLAITGDGERALDALQRAVAAGLTDLAWLKRCPAIASIRDRPEVTAAIEIVEARTRPVLAVYDAGK
jgi:TolB-like protein/predicted Ser/Thr protein kinase